MLNKKKIEVNISMTKKMIEQYVILDMDDNIVENKEDVKAEANSLRVYDRGIRATIARVFSEDLDFNLFFAKEIVAACDEYVPSEPELEPGSGAENAEEGDENNGD